MTQPWIDLKTNFRKFKKIFSEKYLTNTKECAVINLQTKQYEIILGGNTDVGRMDSCIYNACICYWNASCNLLQA